ncbi:hypothetical protein [Streptomyces californicus]|uniref:hypothetical protein n=1 Tax=Streptomyces californicus TaxID=67351 RepID=UPI00368BA273
MSMKRHGSGPPTRRLRAGPPPPGRRSPNLWHALRLRSSRGLMLGVFMCVGGLVGGARGLLDTTDIRTTLGLLGIGVPGLGLTVSWIVTYIREH